MHDLTAAMMPLHRVKICELQSISVEMTYRSFHLCTFVPVGCIGKKSACLPSFNAHWHSGLDWNSTMLIECINSGDDASYRGNDFLI